ncbi:MAG: DnaD domain protein [Lachnospiraceae bacterium]|nr:DnaD domain protein [Lachnospiraceae bacterium]
MSRLTIYKENVSDSITLSNHFIDEYLAQANDAQIKVYLYILRMVSASVPTSISDIADKFNHTERDVVRALSYWEKLGLLSIEYDPSGEICGLQLPSLKDEVRPDTKSTGEGAQILSLPVGGARKEALPRQEEAIAKQELSGSDEQASETVIEKKSYSRDEIAAMKKQEDFAQVLFVTKTYFGRELTSSDLQSMTFIRKDLGFSCELMEYLVEYCVSREHRQMRYVEKVAIEWQQSGIKTVEQAKRRSSRYEKVVYRVMKALGKNSDVTKAEADYILRWCHEYGFSENAILYACEKTVLATDKNRMAYAEAILKSWHKDGLRTLTQVQKAEEKKPATVRERSTKNTASNMIHNQYERRDIDYDSLEKELLKYQ